MSLGRIHTTQTCGGGSRCVSVTFALAVSPLLLVEKRKQNIDTLSSG